MVRPLYEWNTYGPKSARVPWMDLGEVRKTIYALLDEVGIDVPWEHLSVEGHDVREEDIRVALADGRNTLHELVDGRYFATYAERGAPLAIVVCLELREVGGTRRIQVLTAYHAVATRRNDRGR